MVLNYSTATLINTRVRLECYRPTSKVVAKGKSEQKSS